MKTERTYRMYGFVNYQLSGIQAGIQFGHAVQEYNNKINDLKASKNISEEEKALIDAFDKWSRNDKTFIVLNGGTTNLSVNSPGTMNLTLGTLNVNNIFNAPFFEPDLGHQLTAFVFLVDDRVFDKELWPDYNGPTYEINNEPISDFYNEWKNKFTKNEKESDTIIFLREWLPKFKLA